MKNFSESFIEASRQSPLKSAIYRSILNGYSPYLIIEQLVGDVENMQKELAEIKAYGIPPIVITVSETEFNKFKSECPVEHTG